MVETESLILFLRGWQSNFSPSPFEADGISFRQVEQYFMYQKAKFFGDEHSMQLILEATTAHQARELGQLIKPFNDTWFAVRYQVMLQGNLHKYQQNPDYLLKLQQTGCKILAEANPIDRIWGIGLAEDDPLAQNPEYWTGRNLLGLCLMDVRSRLC
jgi:hypothetical protein